jgi:uracil-DNA glycosylase family 4
MSLSREDQYRLLTNEILSCTKCRLSAGRIHAVPGEGPVPCGIMFIGEAPGEKEDRSGHPFAGRAGIVLQDLLGSIGLSRNEVFITSILKCRPPGNRDPKGDEIAPCRPYLHRQIALVQPSVLIPMGRFSAAVILEQFGMSPGRISEIHGRAFRAETSHGSVILFPVYHPAVITHNPPLKSDLVQDFQRLQTVLEGIGRSG